MPTVLRYKAFEFRIYTNDHIPPHVHVHHGSGKSRIEIAGAVVMDSAGMRAADLAAARLVVKSQEAYLLKRWEEIHR